MGGYSSKSPKHNQNEDNNTISDIYNINNIYSKSTIVTRRELLMTTNNMENNRNGNDNNLNDDNYLINSSIKLKTQLSNTLSLGIYKCHCLNNRDNICEYENWRKQKQTPYIQGLNSTLISENIVASQRPSTSSIELFNIIKQFTRYV